MQAVMKNRMRPGDVNTDAEPSQLSTKGTNRPN